MLNPDPREATGPAAGVSHAKLPAMNLPGQRSEVTGARPQGAPRAALVTGAARRLGRAIALALADAGWDIAVHYHLSHDEAEATAADIRACGRRAVLVRADLGQEAEVRQLVPAATRELGPIGLLVNNASRFDQDETTSFHYQNLIDHMLPNLAAPLVLGQEVAAALPADRSGVIVNLLDQKLYNPNPDFLSYTLSKAGLAQATVMLAQALAPRVRVVGVAPGLTLPSYLQDAASFEEAHQRFSPLGRSSTPADVASTVVFIADNPALTGTVIVVDGGQHLMGLPRDVSLMPTTSLNTAPGGAGSASRDTPES